MGQSHRGRRERFVALLPFRALARLLTVTIDLDLTFRSFLDLDNYLKSTQFRGTRMMYVKDLEHFNFCLNLLTLVSRLIPQRFSWDHLLISEAGLRRLLSHFQVTPAIIDLVNAFGAQTSSESDAISSVHAHVRANISG